MQGTFDKKNNFSLFLSKKDGQVQEGELIDDEIVWENENKNEKKKKNVYKINLTRPLFFPFTKYSLIYSATK